MLTAITDVDLLTHERLTAHPDHPFFQFARREIDSLKLEIGDGRQVSRPFYEGMKIGLMCAKELEPIDPGYCDAVYRMLDDIRPHDAGSR